MHRRRFLTSAGTFCAAAPTFSALNHTGARAQDTFNWRMQRYYGTETDVIHSEFARNVSVVSDQALSITHFRGGELVPNAQILSAVGRGTLELGHGNGAYWAGEMDIGNIEAGLPRAWVTLDEAYYMWYGLGFVDTLREAYAERDVHYLCPMFGGKYGLLTKEPIERLSDLKNMKIRAASQVAAVLNQFDIPSVYHPPEELYVALSTGTLDGMIYGGVHDYKALKLDEIATHYTELSLVYPGYVDCILVNKRAWETLPSAAKVSLELGAKEMAQRQHYWNNNRERETRSEGIFRISSLPQEDKEALTRASREVWKEEAEKSSRNRKAVEKIRKIAEMEDRL